MELRRHGDDHVIEVGVEVSAFGYIVAERRVVVVACEEIVGVVDESRLVRSDLSEVGRPGSSVGVLGLVLGEVGRPHSVVDHPLSEVPLLEIVALVFLVSGVDLRSIHHLVYQLSLSKSLVHQQVVFFVNGSMTTLAGPLEDLEPSPQPIAISQRKAYVAELKVFQVISEGQWEWP